jgi:hypothetical protein
MGIFADTCRALVDDNGKALTGASLEAAKRDPKAQRCNYKVKKSARICSSCGTPAPGGWWKCPTCSKWVGNESNFCWNCRAELWPEERLQVSDGRWRKPAGSLAQKFDVGDIKKLLHKKGSIFVEEGSSAILLQNGKFKDLLGPGEHTVDSLGRKINNWGDPPPRTVVLIDSGDVAVPVHVMDLRTAEDVSVELYAEMHIRLGGDKKKAQALMENVIKDARSLSYRDYAAQLESEIRTAARNLCNTSTIEDLFKDPELRLRIEDELQRILETSSARFGFELLRVSAAEVVSPEYELLRKQNGDVELQRRGLEFEQRAREIVQKDRMHEFKTEQDLEEYMEQMGHERGVSATQREHVLGLLKQRQRHEIDDKELDHCMASEINRRQHELEKARIHRVDQLEQAETAAAVSGIKTGQEVDEAGKWLDVRRKKEALKREDEAERIKMVEGRDLQTLLAALPEERHASLLKMQEQAGKAAMSPEQLMAMAIEKTPAAAEALKAWKEAESSQKEQSLEKIEDVLKENADRMERIMREALRTTGEAAKGGSTTQNIVK